MSGYDALTHLHDLRYGRGLDAVVAAARAGGIADWLVAAGDPDRWDAVRQAAARTGGQLALGAHPWWTGPADAATRARWLARLDDADPPVVGEIGLDHYQADGDGERAAQREAFRGQLAWARDRDRPVVLHIVRATPEALRLVEDDGLPAAGGVFHGFPGDADAARRAVDAGLHLGIGPLVLADSGHKIRAAVAEVGLQALVLETDCPDQGPPDVALSGPFHVRAIAAGVARVIGTDVDTVLATTGATARALLGTGRHR